MAYHCDLKVEIDKKLTQSQSELKVTLDELVAMKRSSQSSMVRLFEMERKVTQLELDLELSKARK